MFTYWSAVDSSANKGISCLTTKIVKLHLLYQLSKHGNLRSGTKSDLLRCINNDSTVEFACSLDAIFTDGAMMVHTHPSDNVKTFDENANSCILPYIIQQLSYVTCGLDVIWDIYILNSLKQTARFTRGGGGFGVRKRVTGQGKLPSNWASSLRNDTNKTELFLFLPSHMTNASYPLGKQVVTAVEGSVPVCSYPDDVKIKLYRSL